MVEVGEDRSVAEGAPTRRSIHPQTGDLAPIHEQVVLALEGRPQADGFECADEEPGERRQNFPRGRTPLGQGQCHAKLGISHEDGATASRSAPKVEPQALDGDEVDLGRSALVATDEDRMVTVRVAAQDRLVDGALDERIVEGETLGGTDAVVEDDAKRAHDTRTVVRSSSTPAQLIEQHHSWSTGVSPCSRA